MLCPTVGSDSGMFRAQGGSARVRQWTPGRAHVNGMRAAAAVWGESAKRAVR